MQQKVNNGKNNGNNKGDDGDDDDDHRDDGDDDDGDDDKRYREIEARKKEYKGEGNLDPSVDEEFNEMVWYSKNLEGKTYITGKNESIYANKFNNNYEKNINDFINKKIKYEDIVDKLNKVNKGIKIFEKNQKLYKNSPNIKDQINNSKKIAKGLGKIIVGIDNNKIRIGRDFITEPGSVYLSWMHDPELYEEISQDVFARYNKDKYSNELLSIQSFLDNINEEYIKNKKDELEEFKTVKNNVKSENLKDIVKELELAIFGYDDKESEYEESIAERTKMRRQNKEANSEDTSDSDSDDLYELTEEGYDKEVYDGAEYDKKVMMMLDMTSGVLMKMDSMKMDMTMDMKWVFNEDGFNKDGKKDKKYNKWGYNINGFDRQGFNKDC